ncbi:hypothetical protein K1719_018404 [Acacia pycnantha]|nr:hypothetical protein K1719_018404 [Acacia pycnantha]
MAYFDPLTKQVSIRGETRVIGAEHVHQLMGLPSGGKGIEVKVTEQNPVFRDFRRAYRNVKYKTLGDTLLGKLDENFEYIFVLFTLGTLLAPSASIYVSDRMLKVVTLSKDALGEFDWSSFILQELSQQIYEFNKDSHKSKGNKRKIVGGCVYFLMLFCLQNFALGYVVAFEHESAMAYWTDDKPSVTLSASFDPHMMLTHLEVRSTYFRLVSMLGQEMLALEDRLTSNTNKDEGPQEGLYETESPTTSPQVPGSLRKTMTKREMRKMRLKILKTLMMTTSTVATQLVFKMVLTWIPMKRMSWKKKWPNLKHKRENEVTNKLEDPRG